MRKNEFLDGLRKELKEEKITAELGDSKLLVKTIVEAEKCKNVSYSHKNRNKELRKKKAHGDCAPRFFEICLANFLLS